MPRSKSKENTGKANIFADGPAAFRVSFGERIRWLLDLYDSRVEAAEIAGVTPEHLASYIAGRAKPPFELVARLAQAREISLDWLASGEGERSLAEAGPEGFALIPVLDADASSGHGVYALGEEVRQFAAFSREWIAAELRTPEDKLFVVFNRGPLNEPEIKDGDAMLVDTGAAGIVDDGFYIFDSDGRLLTRMIEHYVDGRIALKTRKPDHGAQVLARDEAARLRVFGRVRWRGGLI